MKKTAPRTMEKNTIILLTIIFSSTYSAYSIHNEYDIIAA